MPTITPFLWYDTQAEEAMNLYASIFKRSKVISVNRAQGKVMSVQFELEGQRFMALNGGPHFKFTEATSFFVGCETQSRGCRRHTTATEHPAASDFECRRSDRGQCAASGRMSWTKFANAARSSVE